MSVCNDNIYKLDSLLNEFIIYLVAWYLLITIDKRINFFATIYSILLFPKEINLMNFYITAITLPIRKYLAFVLMFMAIGVSHQMYGTHIRAGEITIVRTNCNSLTFEITFTGYRDTGSNIIFGDGFMNFGDGSDQLLISSDLFSSTNVGNGIEKNVVTITHTFSAQGLYTISYRELNRNAGTLNIDNSVETPFYTESQIVIDGFIGCNQSPQLLISPVDEGCTQVAFFHNPGAFDPDGDSLSYEFTIPKQDRGVQVINYRDPNSNEAGLYPNGYNTANENGNGPPTFTINAATGDVIWDAPGAEGQYNIAFKIIEWRNIAGEWLEIGYVVRDMQILIEDCDNERPELDIPEDICVEAGTFIDESIIGTDPDNDQVKIEAFSQLFNGAANQPTFTPNPPSFNPVPATSQFQWQTACANVREQPYQVVFKITDSPPMGPKLVTFATWNITVVGPKPDLISATRDSREAVLNFTPYSCNLIGDPAKVQIWRRVASFAYTPDECETGLPENSGYELIDEIGTSASSYRDTNNGAGLAFGAQYCYRLIAVFPEPQGGESIVSDEMCIDPVEVSAPTITHVTIDRTDEDTGEITVSWRSPFELDLSVFTLPLSYRISRATGLSGGTLEEVAIISDTTYADQNLNTTDNAYHYTITAIDNLGIEIETSIEASSVRVEPTPQFEKIELNWSAEVPWSNAIQGQLHEVYRDNTDSGDPTLFVKIAEVETTQDGFRFLDEGQFNNTPLVNTQLYCYFITAKGSYGNPLIASPQINNSQIVCSQPSDTIPPCTTTLFIDELKCRPIGDLTDGDDIYPFDALPCDFADFENKLSWNEPGLCAEDIDHYDVYYKRDLNNEYVKVASVSDTVYTHSDLPSYAGCYVIKSVDRSGNESEFSNEVCKDNCPNYILPNVFTPNGDDKNDTFRAFSDLDLGGENGGIINIESKFCPRFVQSVEFQVFNRWGIEVFSYRSEEAILNGEPLSRKEAILIDWDGRSSTGKELSTGVYFYSAKVKFDALNPENKSRIIKGWVHLLR